MSSNRKTRLLAAVVAADIVAAIFAWRDLDRRTDKAVRGSRKFWRAAMLANPGNSLAYWVVGRRRTDDDTTTLSSLLAANSIATTPARADQAIVQDGQATDLESRQRARDGIES